MSTVHEPLRGASLKAALRAIIARPVLDLPPVRVRLQRLAEGIGR